MNRRLLFTFGTMMLCFSIGSYIMCVDLDSVSQRPLTFEERLNAKYVEKQRFWEWDLGNGYVSATENAVMLLTLFFGFMRTVDLLMEFRRIEHDMAFAWFMNLCDDKIDENHY